MTITDSGINKIFNYGDILEIIDLFTLSGSLSSNDYDQVYSSLIIESIGELSSNEFSNITIDELDNINLSQDSDINNPKIRFKGYGEYKFIFYTIDFFTNPSNTNRLTITVTVTRPTVTLLFKTNPTPDLGTCSGNNCDIINLTYTSSNSQITNTFHPYINDSLVTNTTLKSDIFGDINTISFSLIFNNSIIKNGGTYEITESGTYYLDINSYISTVFIVKFVILPIEVDPVSYSEARFIGPISISYGNLLPSLFSYLTEDPLSTPIDSVTTLNEPKGSITKTTLVDGFSSGSGVSNVNESEIPTLIPGMYILKTTINDTTIYGILDISKANIEIYNSLNPTYSVNSTPTVINFANSIYLIRRITNSVTTIISDVSLTYSITFSPVNGSSPVNITTPTYTMNTQGTLEIIATFGGNIYYKSSSVRFIINIGPIPVNIKLNKKYFITRSELTTSKIAEIQLDMKNNMEFTNKLTGISMTSSQISIIKNDLNILFDDTTFVSRYATIYYRTTKNAIISSLQSSIEIVDYLNITDVLIPKLKGNANSISIKGIKVHDGSQLVLNYTKNSVNYNITLTKNNSGQVHAIDSETNTSSITFVPLSNNIILTTSELNYLDDVPQYHSVMTLMPNGLYRVIANPGSTITNKYVLTNNSTQHIVLTDTISVEIDILNYILDRVGTTNRNFTYLMESPHLIYTSSTPEANYKISSSYLTFKLGSILIPNNMITNFYVMPNLTTLANKSNLQPIETIPLTSTDTYLDIYNNTVKLNLTRSYTLVLPKMVISNVKSNIETWFEEKDIEFDTPIGVTPSSTIEDKVNSIYTETVNYNNTESTITTVMKNYEIIETIVLNENSNDTSRPFWMGLINKLTAFKTLLTNTIKNDPKQYLTNDDIDNANFSSSMLTIYDLNNSTTLDLEDFADNEETYKGHLLSLPATYNKLVSNEVNTIILKKHILASMVMIQKALINFITISYTSSGGSGGSGDIPSDGIYNLESTIRNKLVSFIPSPFNGTYGVVDLNIMITCPYSNIPKMNQTFIYTYWVEIPININVKYINSSNQSANATLTLVTNTPSNIAIGATYNNLSAITAGTATNAEILLEDIASSLTLKYTVSGITIKGSTGITLNDSGLFFGSLTSQYVFRIKKYRSNINRYFKFNYTLTSSSVVNARITQISVV
jgi:hypothetical protein